MICMKKLTLLQPLPLELVMQYWKEASKPHTRMFWHIILSITHNPGKEAKEYAAFLGTNTPHIYRVVQRFNKYGVNAFNRAWGGRREQRALMTLNQESSLMADLKQQALHGRILTMHDIREIVEAAVGKKVSDDYLWDLFKRHNWKKKMPRPAHPKKNKEAQEEFKKNCRIWCPSEGATVKIRAH